jgi:hypothetical protein
MASKADLALMRIELSQPAKKALEALADREGMIQFAIASRLVEWFANQPDAIKAFVLGTYPTEIEADVARMMLKMRP